MTRVAKEFILKHNSPLLRATEMHGERRSFFFFRCAKKQRQQLKKRTGKQSSTPLEKSTSDTRNGNTREANETNATPPLAEEACCKNSRRPSIFTPHKHVTETSPMYR